MNDRPEDLLIAFVLDRSGSMSSVHRETITAFNRFLAEQQADAGRTEFTLVLFDSQSVDVVHDGVPISRVRQLDERSYEPRAATPLLDAVARTIDAAERRLASGWQGKVLFVVLTDGLENASQRWTLPALRARISELRDRGWEFLFLGADQDAWAAGEGLGMAGANTLRWGKDGAGIAAAMATAGDVAKDWRRGVRAKEQLIGDAERARAAGERAHRVQAKDWFGAR